MVSSYFFSFKAPLAQTNDGGKGLTTACIGMTTLATDYEGDDGGAYLQSGRAGCGLGGVSQGKKLCN